MAVAAGNAKKPNLILRYVREAERRESREEFAAAVVNAGRALGEKHLACDARLVAKWEDGDVQCPRPVYQRALAALTGRPFTELGFRQRNAIEVPSPEEFTPERLSLHTDEEGQVWATVGRRTFLVGTSAALLTQIRLTAKGQVPPLSALDGHDLYGFGNFVRERWPDVRLARPQPDYGVNYTALLPTNPTMEGAALQLQLQTAHMADGRAVAELRDLLRWDEFSRQNGRGLLIASCRSSERPRFFAIDSRDARHHAARHGTTSVAVPRAYELDDLTFALLWACASLDTGLQADDQELAITLGELAPYEELSSSAVSREAAPDLGTTSQMWLGSDFCARRILRNFGQLTESRSSGPASKQAAKHARGCCSSTSTPTSAPPATTSTTPFRELMNREKRGQRRKQELARVLHLHQRQDTEGTQNAAAYEICCRRKTHASTVYNGRHCC